MDSARFPVALSSWAVHRALGFRAPDSPATGALPKEGKGVDLRELPALAKAHGFERLEIVHFHLDRTDPTLVDDLRTALAESEVTLQALLVDDGDLSHPTEADRDEAWIASWLETATALGAERARVIGGKTRREGDLDEVARRLRRLALGAGLPLATENWMDVLCDPDRTLRLLELCGDVVGLNLDLGNWTCDERHDWIARIAPNAQTCHAKCDVVDAENDLEGFGRLVDAAIEAGFVGPLTIVNGGGGDREWSLAVEQADFLRSRE